MEEKIGKRYTKEFWAWAREHGLPPRQSRGDPRNLSRCVIAPRLYSQWLKEQKEAKDEREGTAKEGS